MFLSTKPATRRTRWSRPRFFRPSAVFLLAALASAGCSRLSVEWTPKPGEIEITGRTFHDAWLVILAGPPDGPYVRREAPAAWSTVGSDPPGREVLRVAFDHAGVARAAVRRSQLPADRTFVQAVVLPRDDSGLPVAVSDCMAVTWKDGVPALRHHALDVLASPVSVRLLGYAALVLACILLGRLRFESPIGRGLRVAAVFLVAAFLLLSRAIVPFPSGRASETERAPPFWPEALTQAEAALDPLDRVAGTPGLRELVESVRARAPAGVLIGVLPRSGSGADVRDAWQAAWLVWPRRAEVLPPDSDPFARRGVYLIMGAAPKRTATEPLFRNGAGALYAIEEGEPR